MPQLYDSNEGSYYDHLKRKYYYKCEYWITGQENVKEFIQAADRFLQEFIKPKNFDASSSENDIIGNENALEDICACLEDCGCMYPKQLTVYEFYKRIDYYKKKYAKVAAKNKKS